MLKKTWLRQTIIFCFSLLLGILTVTAGAISANDVTSVDVLFFTSENCPYCRQQKAFLLPLVEANDNVTLTMVDVDKQPEKFQGFLEENNLSSRAVPRTIIGDKSFIGFSPDPGELEFIPSYQAYIGYQNQIINAIEAELATAIIIPGQTVNVEPTPTPQATQTPPPSPQGIPVWVLSFLPLAYVVTYPIFSIKDKPVETKRLWLGGLTGVIMVSLFLAIAFTPDAVIRGFAAALPFPLFVFIIALADGFNPCAFTVLIILLSLLTYTKSRRDMALVGSTFVVTSGVMYFVFIMAMVLVGSIFIDKYGQIVMIILGTVITIAGLINIKDFFWFKKSVSLSLSKDQQIEITKKARNIVNQLQSAKSDRRKFAAALFATVLLAIFVNLVELGCTAILPTVYMATLVNYCQTNALLCYSVWTAFYSVVYILPLLGILISFIYSFSSYRLTEEKGRLLKLFAGAFMVFFGLVMIAKPELLVLG
ncbi:glutaredoxin family protein [Arthrospira platensis]|mgnify:CR=1 FL=1|jgi:glutaredoxin/MFS family permease|uniref:Glutaredoxin domain-containing protein n=1 Tax=Limnospira platensis NIES-46 TaxID=1236695 RepID=A0A5M3T8N5_LIMPL|nr:glutaredoxin family protein [Arthrospira platensis]AMW28123.1 glutaredoxin [Arthrospira platensis YZ]KDR57258.1 glutaredoxin [Arthrospira platensis str. Paraca]MBD2711720.1 glutaredoxin family protein [Arthrospira platensis FACHB-835]MDF2209244.1 glutaredoxin family protein [Arthrospira platensis NCB002]MDT9296512.1 glutaredoxin family protein [Arthrospira platensis PCC 7345]MDT9312112.1 glutaredoxin family protein [Limnospira sp. Paracas R14]QQW30918.1 glutaredoxin family protein [Arthro